MTYFLTVWILVHSGHWMFPMGGAYKDLHECEHRIEYLMKKVPQKRGFNLEFVIIECDKIY